MPSQITQALRAENRDRLEQTLKGQDRSEWREYIAEKNGAPDDRRNEFTGY